MRLNRRVPVGTHGGVRGRLSIYESLLLDYGGILSFSRVTFNPPLHLTLTTLLAISLAKLRFFLGIELKAL